jgi:hypothetical protein
VVGTPIGLSVTAPQAYALVGVAGMLAAVCQVCALVTSRQWESPGTCPQQGSFPCFVDVCMHVKWLRMHGAQVPLTAVLLLFELTHDYFIIIPTLASVGISYWVASFPLAAVLRPLSPVFCFLPRSPAALSGSPRPRSLLREEVSTAVGEARAMAEPPVLLMADPQASVLACSYASLEHCAVLTNSLRPASCRHPTSFDRLLLSAVFALCRTRLLIAVLRRSRSRFMKAGGAGLWPRMGCCDRGTPASMKGVSAGALGALCPSLVPSGPHSNSAQQAAPCQTEARRWRWQQHRVGRMLRGACRAWWGA